MNSVVLFSLGLCILGANAGSVPFIKPCHWSDKECILKSSKEALPFIIPGLPSLGMKSLDPLHIKKINGDSDQLKMEFTDLVVEKLSQCEIVHIVRSTRLEADLKFICPFSAQGNYVIGGKLILLDVSGSGKFHVYTDKIEFNAKVTMADNEKEGVKYYKFTKFDFSYEPLEKIFLKFDNLFDGDKTKAEPIEQFMDTNWKEMVTLVGKPMIQNIMKQVISTTEKLFQGTPSNELELPE